MVIQGITTATVLPAVVLYINHKTAVPAPTTAIIPPVQTTAVYAGYTKAKAAAMVVISRLITHQPLRRRLEVTLLHHQEVLQAVAAAAVAEADHHVAEDNCGAM